MLAWKNKHLGVRLSDRQYSNLVEMCQAFECSKSKVVRACLDEAYNEFSKNV